MQNVSHDNFNQAPAGQNEQQNMTYQTNADPALAAAGGPASQQNGVTNITNIIYNFNLTPSQQLHKQQIEQ